MAEPEPTEPAPVPWWRQPKPLAGIAILVIVAVWGLTQSQQPTATEQADEFRERMSESRIDVSRVPTVEIRAAGLVVCDAADNALSPDTFMIQVLSSDVLDTFDLEPARGLAPSEEETLAMAELVNVYCRGSLDSVLD